jgi:ComF family protein
MFGRLRSTVNLGKLPWLTIGQKLTTSILPPRCLLCGGAGQQANELWGLDLCLHCEAALPRCPTMSGGPDPTGRGLDAIRALFLYEDPVDRLITELKFRGELAGARVLGTLLARHLVEQDIRLPHLLVPLPLHAARYRERGFNQAAAIASHVASRTGVAVDSSLLLRVRATAPQTTLDAAARRSNCRGAFAVNTGRHAPARVALLDDVMTTGSTAEAATAALRAAGARHVELWVCAVALRPGVDAQDPDP